MTNAEIADLMWSSAALGVAFFAFCAVLARRIRTRGHALYLDAVAVFLAVQVTDMADDLVFGPPIHAPLWAYGWQDALLPLFMISLWFFVRGLTEPALRLRPRDAWHLLPLGLGLVFLLPFLSLPGPERAGLYVDIDLGGTRVLWAELGVLAFWVGWIGLLIGYGFACARRLTRHKRTIRALFSDLSGKSLWWLDALVAMILGLAWVVIADEVLILAFDAGFLEGAAEGVHEILLGLIFGLFGIQAKPPLPDWSAEVVANETAPAPPPPATEDETGAGTGASPGRYARSGLGPEDLTRLAARLQTRMEASRLWEDPMLTLKTLSEATAIPPMHLSEVLNTEIGQSFFDYVNAHRIEAACSLLAESELGVLEISEAVGYNSKSTFNANFKRITDKTPTEWRRALRAMTRPAARP
ncbi:helix-turn-helix domain-containing protein [Dinoroseobacter sp. S124A]|uniref:helix-turn-helix domain-containing protein n=1 Tax=Dinoroseobacter sp. S124A TaxID=3415128 RepID=UPI003C7D636B